MELENLHIVSGLGLLIGLVVGVVANKTNFCTMGAISDWVNTGHKGRMGAWVLAMGLAVIGTQILELSGLVDIQSSIYRASVLGIGGYVIGGMLFGIGMTLGGGCGQRTLVRVGSGNLKALVVLMVLGITAYATLRGILGIVRIEVFGPLSVDLASQNVEEQGLATLIAHWSGLSASSSMRWIVALVIAALLIGWSMSKKELRNDTNNLLAGTVFGCAVVAAWVVTGLVGVDEFDPVPIESLTFVAPAGNTISYLMTYTGSSINFGIASVLGVILGSFLYAVFSGGFRIETFSQREDMINHLLGGVLMGFGGVLAMGCTIGQGVSGVSTLALGSIIAVLSIILGSAVTMRVQYYQMDEMGFLRSLFTGIADILLPWRKTDD